ncbi:MAG: N-acetylmuramoyl-L-alanine amidase-like domain-containing protein [Smithellaceae bacterium]
MIQSCFQFNLSHFRKQFTGDKLPPGDLIAAIGNYFLTAPYKAGTLESNRQEKLIGNFEQFDCFTFVETVLALTRCVVAWKISRSEFKAALKLIRYRQGIIDGYSSRLHYFTDWLRDNEQKKILRDISRKLQAVDQRKKINYMTTHRQAYRALYDENEFEKMLQVENNISRRIFRIIPKDEVNQQKGKIKPGDVIAFTAAEKGLDVVHAGFAFWQKGKLHLLHASCKEGMVVVSKQTLIDYLKQNKKFTGIIIARFL